MTIFEKIKIYMLNKKLKIDKNLTPEELIKI